MLPDAHQGYGFSIGGVAAIDVEKGCISPGGIGFDINCGVRLLTTPLKKEDVEPKIKELLNSLFRNVPSGVGSESFIRLDDKQLDTVLNNGAEWAVENGYGFKDVLERCEEGGMMKQVLNISVFMGFLMLMLGSIRKLMVIRFITGPISTVFLMP